MILEDLRKKSEEEIEFVALVIVNLVSRTRFSEEVG